ncbi:hypothetical protein AAHA92_26346 [Salvia divinorum]|uniref:Uncharacterized protein n=1 Tax=Salvia divinorum TaxID=28513 RepID=A0ABD1GDM2_SALDI
MEEDVQQQSFCFCKSGHRDVWMLRFSYTLEEFHWLSLCSSYDKKLMTINLLKDIADNSSLLGASLTLSKNSVRGSTTTLLYEQNLTRASSCRLIRKSTQDSRCLKSLLVVLCFSSL